MLKGVKQRQLKGKTLNVLKVCFASHLGKKSVFYSLVLILPWVLRCIILNWYKPTYVMGTSLQYSCLEESKDKRSLAASTTVSKNSKRRTWRVTECACVHTHQLTIKSNPEREKNCCCQRESGCQSSKCKSLDHLDLKNLAPWQMLHKRPSSHHCRQISSKKSFFKWDCMLYMRPLTFHLDLGQRKLHFSDLWKVHFQVIIWCLHRYFQKQSWYRSCFVVTYVENLRTRHID